MGSSHNTSLEDYRDRKLYAERERERERERQRAEAAEEQAERRDLAERIVSLMVDNINADIIRPGPTPEERECYDMAQELRDYGKKLVENVVDQLNVSGGCR